MLKRSGIGGLMPFLQTMGLRLLLLAGGFGALLAIGLCLVCIMVVSPVPSVTTSSMQTFLFAQYQYHHKHHKHHHSQDNTKKHDLTMAVATQEIMSMMKNSKNSKIPTVTIGQDVYGRPVTMPMVGAGTWQYNDTIAYESICQAFQAGYTFVDTAWGYHNQKGVGKAIQDCWSFARQDLFVMTKLPGGLNTTQVWDYHAQNLENLGLEYVDHLMVHFPSDWEETHASPAIRQEGWLALEAIYNSGQARSIGISHYCPQHIHDILEVATVMPSINQVEYHVGSQDIDHVMEICRNLGITFMSFSPLCGPCHYDDPETENLIDGTLVSEIASHYNTHDNNDGIVVTPSQVALKYIVQQGIPVIPKSNTASHIASNRNLFHFELSANDMRELAAATKPAAEDGDCEVP